MKRIVIIAFMLMNLFLADAQSPAGVWYAIKDNARVTLQLNEDGTMSISNEAASNMTFDGSYSISENGKSIEIADRGNIMKATGILRYNNDGSLEMNCIFGPPGSERRPEIIDLAPLTPDNIYLHLYRDSTIFKSLSRELASIPPEAALAFERNARLGSGINLNAVVDGNLHPGYERDAPLEEGEIKSIADAGFDSVRLNVCWSRHCADSYPYSIDPEFFKKVDDIIDECIGYGLAVSVDIHYYPYINMSYPDETLSMEDNYQRLICLWEQIAEHYRNYSDEMLFFDLLNEPNLIMGAERWNSLLAELIRTIRTSNPGRTLIVSTPSLGQSWTLNLLELPEDEWNLIVQFHYYLPHLFTHQGLSHGMAGHVENSVWLGTEEEKNAVDQDLDFCQKWAMANGRPINMGEYGATNTADTASRARYIGHLCKSARSRGFSSHLWGYREVFMIRDKDTGEWIDEILNEMDMK